MSKKLDFITSKDSLKITELSLASADETLNLLKKCADLDRKTPEERQQFDRILKIARSKGKSLPELQQEVETNQRKAKKALELWKDSFDENSSALEKHTESLKLLAEVVASEWDLYPESTRVFLKDFARQINNHLESTNPSEYKDEVGIQENLIARQIFVNAVFGSLERVNCETDLGKKLFSIRQKIILSGEKLMSPDDFDDYLESTEEKEFAV